MPTTPVVSRRALRCSVIALAGVALFAACDTDRPLTPRPDAVPTSPQLAKGGRGGTIIITVVDANGATLTTLGAVFSGTKSAQAKFGVGDNDWGDENPTVGIIQLSGLQNGTYSVCQKYVPAGYLFPTPACQDVGIGGSGPAQVTFVDPAVPRAKWVAKDGVTGDSTYGALFSIDEGSGPVYIVDNQALDLDKRPGVFEVKLSSNGASVKVCPELAPVGRTWSLPLKGCVTKTSNGTTDFGAWNVPPEYSIYWYASVNGIDATDGTYTITAAAGGFSTTITNNDANDLWKNTWIYTALPGAGTYTVCQTVAPTGTKIAAPACIDVQVEFGVPTLVGPFQNQPL